MKSIIASGLLLIGTLFTTTNCFGSGQPANPPSVLPATQAGDGIHIVGDEIRPGLWQAPDNWRERANCAWFVSPAADPTPSSSPSNTPSSTQAKVETPAGGGFTVRLHSGEGLVSSDCAQPGHYWEHISD